MAALERGGFRRNTSGVSATSTFLSLYRSLLLALSLLAFTSDCSSFSLAPFCWLFLFLAFTPNCSSFPFSLRLPVYDGIQPASVLPFFFLLFFGSIDVFRLCRTRYRWNGGVAVVFFRRYPFILSAPSPLLYLSLLRDHPLCLFHFRLLFCIFLDFTSDSMAALQQPSDGMHLASLLPLLCFLFFSLIALFQLCRTRYRLSGGVGARAFDGIHSASSD
jgi:hypothetical protein